MKIAPLPLVLHLLLIWLTAYLAAGTFYVLRGLGEASTAPERDEWTGLVLIALCWLPISLGNLVSVHRTCPLGAVLARFVAETVPPLVLLLAVVALSGGS